VIDSIIRDRIDLSRRGRLPGIPRGCERASPRGSVGSVWPTCCSDIGGSLPVSLAKKSIVHARAARTDSHVAPRSGVSQRRVSIPPAPPMPRPETLLGVPVALLGRPPTLVGVAPPVARPATLLGVAPCPVMVPGHAPLSGLAESRQPREVESSPPPAPASSAPSAGAGSGDTELCPSGFPGAELDRELRAIDEAFFVDAGTSETTDIEPERTGTQGGQRRAHLRKYVLMVVAFCALILSLAAWRVLAYDPGDASGRLWAALVSHR
jgi:hypothetical protein